MIKQPKKYRQGDVLIVAVDSIPPSAPVDRADGADLILQEGEVTGHAHRIASRHAKLYRTEMDARFMRVTAPVALTHEEHKTLCASCLPTETIATHGGPGIETYVCLAHAPVGAPKIEQPGGTVIPPGCYRITIHAEYVPGGLPRQVAD